MRIIVFEGLYSGPLILGNYRITTGICLKGHLMSASLNGNLLGGPPTL